MSGPTTTADMATEARRQVELAANAVADLIEAEDRGDIVHVLVEQHRALVEIRRSLQGVERALRLMPRKPRRRQSVHPRG